MKTSEALNELAAALAKAQGEIRNPGKDKTATVEMKTGGKYTYQYGDLAGITDALRKPFADNGLCHVQFVSNDPGEVHITTRIMHASGQWIESSMTMPVSDHRPQTLGSAVTYGRRYSLGALAGIASEQDDDGAAAQEAATPPPRQNTPRKPSQAIRESANHNGAYSGSEGQREILRAKFADIPDINNDDKHAIAAAMKNIEMNKLDDVIATYFEIKSKGGGHAAQ